MFAPVAFKPTAPCVDTTGRLTFIQKKVKFLALQMINFYYESWLCVDASCYHFTINNPPTFRPSAVEVSLDIVVTTADFAKFLNELLLKRFLFTASLLSIQVGMTTGRPVGKKKTNKDRN